MPIFEELISEVQNRGPISYSRISDFDKNGPRALIKRSEVDNQGVKHGSIVDVLLTDRLTNSNEFDKLFEIVDIEAPTATSLKLARIVINNYIVPLNKSELLKLAKANRFWSNSGDDVILSKFDDSLLKYIEVMLRAKDKQIVTSAEKMIANSAVDDLLYHDFTKDLFFNDFENYYQEYFEFTYKEFILRGIIDKITIDHASKKVKFFDIKTSVNKNDLFMKSFLEYRYYLQGLIYTLAFDTIKKKYNLTDDYTLDTFKFIFMSKVETSPRIWEMSEKWQNAARLGFITKNGYVYKGLDQLLEEIKYHVDTNQYEFSKNVFETHGALALEDKFIEVLNE